MIVGTKNQVNRIFQNSISARDLNGRIHEGRLIVGPALADEILRDANYEHQRPIRPYQVKLLANIMRQGNWMPGSQIAFARLNNSLHLVNGQHRMRAIIESGRTEEFQTLITSVISKEDVAALYYRFDVALGKRSTADILNAAELSETHGVTKTMANVTYKVVGLIMHNLRRPHYLQDPVAAMDVDARLEAAEPWWPIAAQYEAAIEPAPSPVKAKLRTIGTAAVGFVTLRYQPEDAFRFWNGIAENDGLKKGDPRRALLIDLNSRQASFGLSIQPQVAASLAWSAFFERRNLQMIKVVTNATIRVAGTPFRGNK